MAAQITLEELARALQTLENAIFASTVRGEHLFPDLALTGLARDVLEQGAAVLMIAQSDVPRSIYPNARAAFEAALEVLFLATADNYDRWGARVRAAEIADDRYTRELAQTVFAAKGEPSTIPLGPEASETVEGEAQVWDEHAQGKGPVLREAFREVMADRARGMFSWTGLRRTALMDALEPRIGNQPGTGQIFRSWYNLLSVEAHPAPRISTRHLKAGPNSTIKLRQYEEGEVNELLGMGIGATYVAVEAARVCVGDLSAGRLGQASAGSKKPGSQPNP